MVNKDEYKISSGTKPNVYGLPDVRKLDCALLTYIQTGEPPSK